jgi:hypothetical protein
MSIEEKRMLSACREEGMAVTILQGEINAPYL